MAVIAKLKRLIRRKRRARQLGIRYTRAANWQAPKSLLVNGRYVDVLLPGDTGSKIAFLDILLDDCYGICQKTHY